MKNNNQKNTIEHTPSFTPPYSREVLQDKLTPDWSIRETLTTGADGGPAQ